MEKYLERFWKKLEIKPLLRKTMKRTKSWLRKLVIKCSRSLTVNNFRTTWSSISYSFWLKKLFSLLAVQLSDFYDVSVPACVSN